MVKLSDGSTEFMKYKKAEPLLSQGSKYYKYYGKMGKLIFTYTDKEFLEAQRESFKN